METLSMSKTERRRLDVFGRVRGGEVTLVKASELLGLSYRQAKRSCGASQRCVPGPSGEGAASEGDQRFGGANAFLDEEFLAGMNEKFNVPPREQGDLHRRVPREVKLERVLSFQVQRVVQNDWTIRWRNRWFQLTEANRIWHW